MIGKHLVKIKTVLALRRNDAIRISDAYENAKNIALIYTYNDDKRLEKINEFIAWLKKDGKKVKILTYLPKVEKGERPDFNFFTEKDMSAKGKWKKENVREFEQEPFDYLISMDWEVNKFFRHIFAASKAKCRIGSYEEGYDKYFELMINHGDDNYDTYVDQLYHYLKNMRNE